MKDYRIMFWEEGRRYCMVIGTTDLKNLTDRLKNQYDRFTIEEIVK